MEKEFSFGIIPFKKTKSGWKVLLVQLHAGHFSFPKGHAEEGEEPFVSACRELKEETNLEVDALLLSSPIKERFIYKKGSKTIEKTVTYFIAEVKGHLKIQEQEIKDYKWVPLEEAEALATYPEAKRLCRDLMTLDLH